MSPNMTRTAHEHRKNSVTTSEVHKHQTVKWWIILPSLHETRNGLTNFL